MTAGPQQAFLLPAHLSAALIEQVVALAVDLTTVTHDSVTFPEGGSDVDLELAVPFLPGMDEVVVNTAQLVLRASETELTIDRWHAIPGPGGSGVFVIVDTPARLRRLVIDASAQPADSFPVIRSVTLDAAGTPKEGPPMFSGRTFHTGAMFPDALAGLSVVTGTSKRMTLSVPPTQGQAWLVQFATGGSPADLTPSAGVPGVYTVTVAPAASDVTLVLRAPPGSAQPGLALWQHPGPLLTDTGDQTADFTPAAGQSLSAVLAALNASHDSAALSLPVRFHASTAGTLEVTRRALDVRYVSHPVSTPLDLALDGGWVDLVLDAPSRRPDESTLRLSARHLGTAVNPGSGVPPARTPPGGLRVGAGRLVAGSVRWEQPASGGASAGPPELAVLRLLAAPVDATEVVCEVRADASGAPGAVVAGPLVAQLRADERVGWVSLPLPAPVPVTAPATLWVTVRTNLGELEWFALPGTERVLASADGGDSWGDAEAHLGPRGGPAIQLMHVVDPGQQRPVLTVRVGDTDRGTIPLASVPGPSGGGSAEYAGPSPPALPAAVLAAMVAAATAAGPDRTETTFSLWSADTLQVTVAELTCSYDPFSGG